MKNSLRTLFTFFETKAGLLILTFLVTTTGGSVLSFQIQKKSSENEHNFEMYKIRLAEAKELQKHILNTSGARVFSLHQIFAMLANPEKNSHKAIEKYWAANVTQPKDTWNKELDYFYAESRALFSPALSDMLYLYEESKPIVHDAAIAKIDQRIYEQTIPRTLHGALVDAHATAYYWLTECDRTGKCDEARLHDLSLLSMKQMEYLVLVQSCLAARISGELLRYPYGPMAASDVSMPDRCKKWAPT